MYGKCCVSGCPNKSLHMFPINETMRLKWIQATKVDRQRKIGWHLLNKGSSICGKHFKQSDYHILSSGTSKARRLKKTAIPSVFPWPSTNEDEQRAEDEASTSSTTVFNPGHVTKTYSKPVLPMAFAEEILFHVSTSCDNPTPIDPLEITNHDRDDPMPINPMEITDHDQDDPTPIDPHHQVKNDQYLFDSADSEVVTDPSNSSQGMVFEMQGAILKSEIITQTITHTPFKLEVNFQDAI